MQITVELPDNPLVEAAIRYNAAADGYRNAKEWLEELIIGALQSGAEFDSKLFSICQSWDSDLSRRYEQKAA
jgi:hypothetical protein